MSTSNQIRTLAPVDANDTTWVVISTTHDEDCLACNVQVESARVMARVSGSIGATHEEDGPYGQHSATVRRATSWERAIATWEQAIVEDQAAAHEAPDHSQTVTCFTFGVQYARKEHPLGFDRVHPDGWWEVVGVSHDEARLMVTALTGGQWALDYPGQPTHPELYARGCIYRIVAGTTEETR